MCPHHANVIRYRLLIAHIHTSWHTIIRHRRMLPRQELIEAITQKYYTVHYGDEKLSLIACQTITNFCSTFFSHLTQHNIQQLDFMLSKMSSLFDLQTDFQLFSLLPTRAIKVILIEINLLLLLFAIVLHQICFATRHNLKIASSARELPLPSGFQGELRSSFPMLMNFFFMIISISSISSENNILGKKKKIVETFLLQFLIRPPRGSERKVSPKIFK